MIAPTVNRRIVLASRPRGEVREENFRLIEAPLERPREGEVLVRNHWLSLDPYIRGRMDEAKSYAPSLALGEVLVGTTVGEVIESRQRELRVGDWVVGEVGALGWQLYALSDGSNLRRIDPRAAPPSWYLGALGMPGATAWIGLFEIGAPRPGETVVVSAATGAVGSLVGQLAKLAGCRAIGIAGGAAKCDYAVKELGYDACVDHRSERFAEELAAAAGEGIDVLFENVGGAAMDAALRLLKPFARVALCGLVSQYNALEPYGYRNLRALLVNRVRLQGFIVTDHKPLWPRAFAAIGEQLRAGRIRYRESIVAGLENAPRAFIGLLRGENFGKQLVRLA